MPDISQLPEIREAAARMAESERRLAEAVLAQSGTKEAFRQFIQDREEYQKLLFGKPL